VQLQNHDGAFVAPSVAAFGAGVAGANWGTPAALDMVPLDPRGANAWPITATTFVLVPRQPPKAEKTRQVLAFFDWSFKNGDATATSHGFMPLPQAAKDTIRKRWAAMIKDPAGQALYKPKS
jgi:phosphate transport system substrate-binding protein